MKSILRIASLLSVFTLVTPLLQGAPASPVIAFDATRVTASGFHAGREVILFGVATAPGPYFLRLLQYTQTLIASADGSAFYEISTGVPERSIWFAVDSQTREYVIAAPGRISTRARLAPPATLAVRNGAADAINIESGLADILLVRPGMGVWSGSCGRNSRKDINRGKIGAMQLALDQMTATSKTTGPPTLILPSDLVIVVDAETLSYYAGSIGRF